MEPRSTARNPIQRGRQLPTVPRSKARIPCPPGRPRLPHRQLPMESKPSPHRPAGGPNGGPAGPRTQSPSLQCPTPTIAASTGLAGHLPPNPTPRGPSPEPVPRCPAGSSGCCPAGRGQGTGTAPILPIRRNDYPHLGLPATSSLGPGHGGSTGCAGSPSSSPRPAGTLLSPVRTAERHSPHHPCQDCHSCSWR